MIAKLAATLGARSGDRQFPEDGGRERVEGRASDNRPASCVSELESQVALFVDTPEDLAG